MAPAISCGVYGYPLDAAANIAIETTLLHLHREELPGQVIFACFGADTESALKHALAQHTI